MSRAKSIGNVYAELSVRDKMTMGLQRAGKSLSKFGKQATRYTGTSLAVGVTAASAALLVGSKRTLTMVADLDDMAKQTGIATDKMMQLQQAYVFGGGSAKDAGKDIAKMQKAIASSKDDGSDPFSSMGVSLKELMSMTPDEQFKRIGEAILKIENPTLRNAKAMEIFGKSGSKLTTVFGEIERGSKYLGRMPELAAKFADRMAEADDIVQGLNTKKDQFFMGFTAGIIDEVLPGLRKVDEQDFTGLGENIGNAIGHGFSSLMDGTLLDVVALKVTAWALDVGNVIVSAFEAAFKVAKDKASNIWSDIKAGLPGADLEAHQKQILSRGEQKSFGQTYRENIKTGEAIGKSFRDQADQIWNDSKVSSSIGDGIYSSMRKSGDDLPTEPAMEAEKEKSRSWEETSSQVSEMQSRGLSYGSADVPNMVKEQAQNIRMLYELMKSAVTKGDILFT